MDTEAARRETFKYILQEAGTDILILVGRLLFAWLFLVSSYGHLTRRKMMAGYAAGRGLPAPEFFVVATGVQMAVGSMMVALGLWPDLGALILALRHARR